MRAAEIAAADGAGQESVSIVVSPLYVLKGIEGDWQLLTVARP
jgi:hypothetical protein